MAEHENVTQAKAADCGCAPGTPVCELGTQFYADGLDLLQQMIEMPDDVHAMTDAQAEIIRLTFRAMARYAAHIGIGRESDADILIERFDAQRQ